MPIMPKLVAFSVGMPKSIEYNGNKLVTGMTENNVFIGDIYQIGDAIVQISQGRIPCKTISKSNHVQSFLDRIIETGYTGYFCRVLQEGIVRENSPITLLERHPQEVTVFFANRVFFHEKEDRKGIEKILAVTELAPVWKNLLTKRLEKLSYIQPNGKGD
jgi:MOSC domain-containing protein YiiM